MEGSCSHLWMGGQIKIFQEVAVVRTKWMKMQVSSKLGERRKSASNNIVEEDDPLPVAAVEGPIVFAGLADKTDKGFWWGSNKGNEESEEPIAMSSPLYKPQSVHALRAFTKYWVKDVCDQQTLDSFLLILVTFVRFTIFDGAFLAEKLTVAISIIGSVLFTMVIVNMFKTTCSEPGILPRASAPESDFIVKSYATGNGLGPPPRTKDIVVNGQTIKSKYCFTCKMFRPPRACHCGVCDNCVGKMTVDMEEKLMEKLAK